MKGVELKNRPNNSLNTSSFASQPALLLFLLLGFIAYWNVLDAYFLSDDFVQVGKVLAGDWSTVWGREHGGFFRPLFIVSYILDASLWGENPLGYHLTSVAIHAVNSYLISRLALKLLRGQMMSETEKSGAALFAGLIFLLHPSHTEAVSWIAGRADLLATLFCLASMLFFLSWAETGRRLQLALSALSFSLALLSKEAAATLPLILLALGIIPARAVERRTALKNYLKASIIFFAILFIFIAWRRAALGSWVGGYGAGQHLNFSPGWIRDRLLQAALRAVFPPFSSELEAVLLKPLKSTAFILFAIFAAAALALLIRRRRAVVHADLRRVENRLSLSLALMFILSLLPVINLRLSLFDTQGERFIYWPSAFISILIPFALGLPLRNLKLRVALLACLLVFYSVSLYRTNRTWKEAAELSRSVTAELSRAAALSDRKSLLVINAPDNLRGVPLFHNGLEEALRTFQKNGRGVEVRTLTLHAIASREDEILLEREGDLFSLRLPEGVDGFTKVASPADCLKISERNVTSLRFRLENCTDNTALFLFSRGKIYRVVTNDVKEGATP